MQKVAPQIDSQLASAHSEKQDAEGIELTKSSPKFWHMGPTLAIVVWWPPLWCLHHW